MDRALDDWAVFAITGDLGVLGDSFVVDSPQWNQLRSEAGAVKGVAGTPSRLEARRIQVRTVGTSQATVWAEVEASRVGFESKLYTWDFDLVHRQSKWLVWTVVAADEPADPIETLSPAAGTPPTTRPPEPLIPDFQPGELETGAPAVDPVEARGIRIRALSAWFIVLTLVGVAAAGYMAPRIDRKGER